MTAPQYDQMLLADWELRDDLVEVTLTNHVTSVETTGIKAATRSLNFKETMLGGQLGFEPTDRVWVLGAGQMGAVVPHLGDKITTAAEERWTILSVSADCFGDSLISYTVICRKQL